MQISKIKSDNHEVTIERYENIKDFNNDIDANHCPFCQTCDIEKDCNSCEWLGYSFACHKCPVELNCKDCLHSL